MDCLVAPYEADAQLAFLNKAGIAHAIITEDSDLLAFGCKKVKKKMFGIHTLTPLTETLSDAQDTLLVCNICNTVKSFSLMSETHKYRLCLLPGD